MPNNYDHDDECPICHKLEDKCKCDDVVRKLKREVLVRYREAFEKLADS